MNYHRWAALAVVMAGLAACVGAGSSRPTEQPVPVAATVAGAPAGDSRWWHDRVFYEIFVRSFADSSSGPLANDGIGDFQGIIERLDYLNDGDPATGTDLGITGLWLMPISPSPSYHGYDVTDYYGLNPQYGTRADFERLLAECHRRGIRVIVDLVLNHSSSEHPYFRAALAGDRRYRDWYLFVPAREAPDWLGPWGQQVWQQQDGQHYYGIFWAGMPDLNYGNATVSAEARRIARHWLLDVGVDGFRLDAIRHLVEDGEQVSDTPATRAWLAEFQRDLKALRGDALTVGEVWTNTALVSDYVHGGAVDLAFEFDLAGGYLDAARSGQKGKLAYHLADAWAAYPPNQFASFLTNHDMDRVMSVLKDEARARLAAGLLLTGPGVPFIYYGEEIGMPGVKPDERLRTPMPWTGGAHGGFTGAPRPWERLQKGFESRNVAAQGGDPASLLSYYRRLVQLRHAEPALARGELAVVETSREDVLAFVRRHAGRELLVVANLGGETVPGLPVVGVAPGPFTRELLADAPLVDGRLAALGPRSVYVLAR